MVSLGRNFSTSTGGGVFFNDSSISVGEDDSEQLQPVLGPDVGKKFVPLKTVAVVSLEVFLAIAVLITSIVLAVVWLQELEKCEPYFIILYIHAAYWFISLVLDNHIKQKHHVLRINGYLEFYQQTQSLSRIPFYVTSLWNAVLLVVSTLYQHLYEDFRTQCNISGFWKPANLLCIIISVETVIVTSVAATYIHKVVQFNRSKPPPDVLREEWMTSFIQDSYSGGEVGYRERGDHIHDLLEKQADLIRYLKDRNAKLSHKILMLSTQIRREQQ